MIIYNPSISEPRGYYFTVKNTDTHKNDIVQICLDKPKYVEVLRQLKLPFHNKGCNSGMAYLLKKVVAINGDDILINAKGVFINGALQKNSSAVDNARGINLYPIKDRRFTVGKNEFFVLGQTPHSYDSRYFGVITESQIIAKAYLIYTSNHRFW